MYVEGAYMVPFNCYHWQIQVNPFPIPLFFLLLLQLVYILLMDPVQQVELRDLMRIKAKTNPKPLNIGSWLYNSHALLPLFIIFLLVSYFLPGLRCYFCPVSISCANLVSLLAGKKALFLFSNFIFILLVVDFTLSSPSNSFTSSSTLRNDNSASLEGRLPSDSNARDAPAAAEQLHDDDSLWMSSSLEVEQVMISLVEQKKSSISVDSFAEDKKLAKEESKTNIDIFGDSQLTEIGDRHIEWRPEYSNKSQQGRRMKIVERGNIPTLEVAVVDDAIGKERTELEAFGIEDELEHLELEELNRKFDEFIARKKNKWRSESEALQLVMHGRLV